MTKDQVVSSMAERTGMTKKLMLQALNAFIDTTIETVENGGKVQLVDFLTIEAVDRKARQGRNPRNPEEVIEIPAKRAPKASFGKAFKDRVNATK